MCPASNANANADSDSDADIIQSPPRFQRSTANPPSRSPPTIPPPSSPTPATQFAKTPTNNHRSLPFFEAPIALESLPTGQLTQIKKQLDDEVQHFSTSFQSLRGAQAKFRECLRCVRVGLGGSGDAGTKTVAPTATTTPSKETTSVGSSSSEAVDKTILVPLTTSLYVPGVLAPAPRRSSTGDDEEDDDELESQSRPPAEQTVMVDIGTGYFVDKTLSEADEFYTRKIDELEASLASLEKVLKGKTENLRVVEEGQYRENDSPHIDTVDERFH